MTGDERRRRLDGPLAARRMDVGVAEAAGLDADASPRLAECGFSAPTQRRFADGAARTARWNGAMFQTIAAKSLRYGGIAASTVLIAFGIGAIVTGFNGRDQVRTELAREQIVGTPDSTIPGRLVDTGSEAQAFASIMRHHTLDATGGKTYSQMGQYLDASGNETSDKATAAIDPKTKKPVANPARQIWVTETALSTALNTAFFAESVATFAIVMGFALLLSGVGFTILTLKALTPSTTREARRVPAEAATVAV
jgi:hypothetical protein